MSLLYTDAAILLKQNQNKVKVCWRSTTQMLCNQFILIAWKLYHRSENEEIYHINADYIYIKRLRKCSSCVYVQNLNLLIIFGLLRTITLVCGGDLVSELIWGSFGLAAWRWRTSQVSTTTLRLNWYIYCIMIPYNSFIA